MLSLKCHQDIEMEVEFDEPVVFALGYDDQDEAQLIEEIKEDGSVVIFHQGNVVGGCKLEELHIETLINVLDGMEESLKSAKKFLDTEL